MSNQRAGMWVAEGAGMNVAVPAKPRLLVVDDREPVRSALARSLRVRHSVAIAAGAEAALKLLMDEPFDAVLSDFDMPPGPDGLALLREVERRFPSTLRFLMTGDRAGWFAPDVASGLLHGLFPKPVSPAEFARALDERQKR